MSQCLAWAWMALGMKSTALQTAAMLLVPAQTCQNSPNPASCNLALIQHISSGHPCSPLQLGLCPSSPFAAGYSSTLWEQARGTLQSTWHIPGHRAGLKLATLQGWPSSLACWRGQTALRMEVPSCGAILHCIQITVTRRGQGDQPCEQVRQRSTG